MAGKSRAIPNSEEDRQDHYHLFFRRGDGILSGMSISTMKVMMLGYLLAVSIRGSDNRLPHGVASKTIAYAFLLALLPSASSQYQEGTPQFEQQQWEGEQSLMNHLLFHPDVAELNHGQGDDSKADNRYRESYPPEEDYVISILVNPCGTNGTRHDLGNNGWRRRRQRALGYDCCMGRFGQGEYGRFRDGRGEGNVKRTYADGRPRGLEVSPNYRLAGPDDLLSGNNDADVVLVDEFGMEIPNEYSRLADDDIVFDSTCRGRADPDATCVSSRLRAVRSPYVSACTDHNQTVDSTLDCYTPDGGVRRRNCMQISYMQTAYIFLCGGGGGTEVERIYGDRCGTYIEIHRQNGSPYDEDEGTVLSDVQITTRETNGMTTTTIPLTYKSDPRKIMCAYEETKIRIGAMVRVRSGDAIASTCCCPPAYSVVRKVGSFLCPRKRGTRGGPFADAAKNLNEEIEMEKMWGEYPYCRVMDDDVDAIMCSAQSKGGGLFDEFDADGNLIPSFYTYPCDPIREYGNGKYGSDDLEGTYDGTCPLGEVFAPCGSLPSNTSRCHGNDVARTFAGEVGKVVSIPADPSFGSYLITFNDGRTSYSFREHELELFIPANSYELWFVQRNRFERIVQNKKSFRVVWPPCTFDPVNDRYYPYAMLDDEGMPMRVFSQFDGVIQERNYTLVVWHGMATTRAGNGVCRHERIFEES